VNKNRVTDPIGLRLSRLALRELKVRGIFAHSPVSLEHQHLARRYVVRGVESGGAVGDVGRYVTFAGENGEPIDYLHPVETIGVNGIHAVVVAPVLVRVEMLRKGRTYELLVSRHAAGKAENGQRPQLQTRVLFRGVHGRLDLDLSGRDKAQAGAALPIFYSSAGEEIAIPERFKQAVGAVTKAVNCIGCSHGHYTRAPNADRTARTDVPKRTRLAAAPELTDSSAAQASTASPNELTGVAEAA
jgi:hypothetical protein